MRGIARLLICFVGSAATLPCQSAETPPKFEIADVHPSPKARNPFRRGPIIRSGRYELRNATMVDLVSVAWDVDPTDVFGGPNWLEIPRFDIFAKIPEKSTPEDRKLMLQSLLSGRFGLKVHSDIRPLAAFALTAGKHPALKTSNGPAPNGCLFNPPDPGAPPGLAYLCRNMTMAAFARNLRNLGRDYLNGAPVVDQTGLKGTWDFDFKFSFRQTPIQTGSNKVTLNDAIEKQLGLKLEPVKIALPVIVVDTVNDSPAPNPPGTTESLRVPPPPTEFEVADVKPANPDTRGMNFRIQPGGRVTLSGATLKFLIQQAYDLNDDMLVGAPKWLDSDRFEILAKAPTTDGFLDFDAVWTMMRSLLAERFRLAVHTENRSVQAYTLIAVKPKLKPADPASRTKFQEGPGPDGKDPRDANPVLSRLVYCQNMTMAQFAERLKEIASGYIHSPVLDATELEGGYDFTLSFSPAGTGGVRAPGRAGDTGQLSTGMPQASDPSGALTLFEAIEKQLGLKLEPQKRVGTVLVIDHVEQKPLDN